jgi:S-disulfanyl-L-cysteine oxidoreductase SoxD
MRCSKLVLPAIALAACLGASSAQTPDYKNVGRTPTAQEIQAWNISVGPEGKELPPGSGSAKQGATIFEQKCAMCHGIDLQGSPLAPRLVRNKATADPLHPERTIGAYWPFATTIWDYINRAMPRNQEGSLNASQVYALTALILYRNGIIKETDLIDAKSLPKVRMPNRDGFVPSQLGAIADLQKRGCSAGHCP